MNQIKGNIIILFVIIILVIFVLISISFKNKIQKAWDLSESKTKPQITDQKNVKPLEPNQPNLLVNNPSQATEQATERYEYYNDLSTIKENETLNPFILRLNSNPSSPTTLENQNTGAKKSTSSKPKTNINLITHAPNGQPLPKETGYLSGYAIKNGTGQLKITINNTHGHSNLMVFLYLKRTYTEPKNIDHNTLMSAIYLNAGNTYTIDKVQSGYYKIFWVNLANRKGHTSDVFPVYKDNKYAYDRIFTFYPQPKMKQN